MEYRKLGRSDIDVSVICLGTMTWGEQNNEEEGHQQLDYAVEQGVNFIDTAELYSVPPRPETYGRTEEILGSWLNQSGKRQDLVIATKISGAGLGWIRDGQPISGSGIRQALEDSLGRLQTDYVDLYQLHWPNRGSYHFQKHWDYRPDYSWNQLQDGFHEILVTLDELTQEGKIRCTGLSNESAWGTMRWLGLAEQHDLTRMASIQNEYSLLCRLFEPDLHEIAVTENCGLLAWSPLACGILSGKYLYGKRPKGSRFSVDPRSERRLTPQAEQAVEAYIQLAEAHELDPCQMALAFVNQRPFVTSTIIGATTMEQLKTNIASIDTKLSGDVLQGIDDIRRRLPMPY